MKIKVLFILVGMLLSESLLCQNIWTYCLNWTSGDPISNTIGAIQLNQSPSSQQINSCSGATIDFSARFADLDDATCVQGTFKKQFPLSDYNIKIESSSSDAVFQNGSTVMNNVPVQILQMQNPFCPTETFDVFITIPATLTISPNWNGSNIDVTVTVIDLGASLPACHTGDPIDSNNYTYTWTISQASNIPNKLIRASISPPENMWTSYVPPLYSAGGVAFDYRGMPDPPPAYQGVIVNEEFPTVTSGGIFNMNDLTNAWKNAHPNILTPDAAAQVIFGSGLSNSFPLDSNNEFEDYHAGWAMDVNMIPQIFTPSAISNKRVGYKYDQNYSSCSVNLGSTEIWRRIDSSLNVELKKKHNL